MFDYDLLPEHIRGGMKLYLEDHVEPGGFLRAVLENDLVGASAKPIILTGRGCLTSLHLFTTKCPRPAGARARQLKSGLKEGKNDGEF